ncbi:RNA polymerase sigma factor [Phytohabitans sp. LJ34]|uniref:RNA polymerase sigma factor n=1 Tax=Phytohabitans sp. LJ34 TaxID=3452217 RepID=UPI003F8B36E2
MASAYAVHAGELLGFCRRSLRDYAAAEDVVQEVFMRAWRHCHRFEPGVASLRTWLFAIARNAVIDVVRAGRRRAWQLLDHHDLGQLPTPDHDLNQLFDWELLAAALDRISVDHRTIIAGFYLRQRTYEELASELGIPMGTVKSRLYYALRTLRAALGQ